MRECETPQIMDAENSSHSIQRQRKTNQNFYEGVVTDLKSRIKKHANCIEDLHFVIIKLTQEKSNVENINKGLEDLLQKERSKQKDHIRDLKNEIENTNKEKENLERYIGEQSKKYKEVSRRINELEEQRKTNAIEIKHLKETIEKLRSEKEALLRQLSQERELAKAKQDETLEEKRELQVKLEKLEEEINGFKKDKDVLKESEVKLAEELETMKEREKENEKEIATVKSNIEKLETKHQMVTKELENEQKLTNVQNKVLETLFRQNTDEASSQRQIFDEETLNKIRYIFVSYIHPDEVLHFFHKYDCNVLSQPDIERVRACTQNLGKTGGACQLLGVLPYYKDWYGCLIQVLHDPQVKMAHVARMMQNALAGNTSDSSLGDDPLEDAENTQVKMLDVDLGETSMENFSSHREQVQSDGQTLLKMASPASDPHEIEFSNADESLLTGKKCSCRKNQGHTHFFSLSNLNFRILPENLRNQDILAYIKSAANLTVRCAVSFTSRHRAERYTLRGLEGAHLLTRYGSGIAWRINRQFSTYDGHTCPCKNCQREPGMAPTHWGEFQIETCKYIVYNTEESLHTTCRIFYDSDEPNGEADDGESVVNLIGAGVTESCADKDYCSVNCVTHDQKVSHKIEAAINRFWRCREDLKSKSFSRGSEEETCVMISHIHGLSKQISIGKRTRKDSMVHPKWSYDVPSCPGASGAPVLVLHDQGQGLELPVTINCVSNMVAKQPENESGGRWWW